MGTRASIDIETDGDIRELADPEFFRYWSELRHRIALSGKSVPCDLKRRYAAVAAEYHRRAHGE